MRVEQLYPLQKADLDRALAGYGAGVEVVWVQEEPWNMGAWYSMQARLPEMLGPKRKLSCVSRPESASPATGSLAAHKLEQAQLVDQAFSQALARPAWKLQL